MTAAPELGDQLAAAGDGDIVDAVASVASACTRFGGEEVAAAARRYEDDVGGRRHGDRAPAVAGAREGRIGEGEDHAAVTHAVPVQHLVPDGQLGASPALPVVEQLDAEHSRGGIGGEHHLDRTGLTGGR